jgi:hypothetical protein
MRRLLPYAPALLVGSVALWRAVALLLEHAAFIHDDAFITLRYAMNLASGEGLTWNPAERVEGYTSIVAVLGIAALVTAGVEPTFAPQALNLLAVLAMVGFVGWRFLRPGPWSDAPRPTRLLAASVAGGIVLAAPPIWVWVWGGLEGPLFAALVCIGFGLLVFTTPAAPPRRWLAIACVFGLVTVTRPDGALFSLVAIGHVAALLGRERWREVVGFAGAAVALPCAQQLFRLAYYGDWLPTSVRAKSLGIPAGLASGGFEYLGYFIGGATSVAIAVLVLAPLAGADPRKRAGIAALVAAAASYALIIALLGGDYMVGFRLLLPLWPLAALIAGLAVLHLVGSAPGVGWGLAIGLAIAIGLPMWTVKTGKPDASAFVGRLVGEHIRDKWPAGTVVALNTAGSTPYHAPRYRYIDMLGINDATIAARRVQQIRTRGQHWPGHSKGYGRYVLGRRPDVIILGLAEGSPAGEPWFLSDIEIVADPRFAHSYREQRERIDATGEPHYHLYPLTRNGYFDFVYYQRVD